MKVGTDGVLLGAWISPCTERLSTLPQEVPSLAPTHLPLNCLDIGTGTGVIALMLAQRFPTARIEGIDIDEASLLQAKENVEASCFADRISIREADFSNLKSFTNKYNIIVSNPPFYNEDTLSGNQARDKARHTVSLPFEVLIRNAAQLLTEKGNFSVIIPYQNATDFISTCALHQLYLTRRTDVRSSERKPFKRTLLEFGRDIRPADVNTMTLHNAENQRTAEYTELTKDFYL